MNYLLDYLFNIKHLVALSEGIAGAKTKTDRSESCPSLFCSGSVQSNAKEEDYFHGALQNNGACMCVDVPPVSQSNPENSGSASTTATRPRLFFSLARASDRNQYTKHCISLKKLLWLQVLIS